MLLLPITLFCTAGRGMNPKQTGEFVSKLSRNVKICNEKIMDLSDKLYSELQEGLISPSKFSEHPCHPSASEAALNWIFLVDTLNFCFWNEGTSHWEVECEGTTYTGYFALCASIKRSLADGLNVLDPQVYSKWEMSDLEYFLRGDNGVKLKLMSERLDCLKQVGSKLLDKYKGDFSNCVKECKKSAQQLLTLIVEEFPCFRDEADYCGKRVSLYKRAQILIGDIWSCFEGQGLGAFDDIHTITMFADYRVPQVLLHFGVLEYSKELYSKLERGEILTNGCVEEVEIRACSIEAVERIKERVDQLIKDSNQSLLCNSILIDHYLWTYRRQYSNDLKSFPYHKTICIYY